MVWEGSARGFLNTYMPIAWHILLTKRNRELDLDVGMLIARRSVILHRAANLCTTTVHLKTMHITIDLKGADNFQPAPLCMLSENEINGTLGKYPKVPRAFSWFPQSESTPGFPRKHCLTGAYFSLAGVVGAFPDTLPACLTNFLYSVTSECLSTSHNLDVHVLSAQFNIRLI